MQRNNNKEWCCIAAALINLCRTTCVAAVVYRLDLDRQLISPAFNNYQRTHWKLSLKAANEPELHEPPPSHPHSFFLKSEWNLNELFEPPLSASPHVPSIWWMYLNTKGFYYYYYITIFFNWCTVIGCKTRVRRRFNLQPQHHRQEPDPPPSHSRVVLFYSARHRLRFPRLCYYSHLEITEKKLLLSYYTLKV